MNLVWKENFTLLGIHFDPFLENMNRNFDLKIRDIENTMSKWEYRFLSPLGRACVVKTLLIPKINHISLVLPSLNNKDLKKLEDKLYSFIWKGRDKVARADAKAPEKKGGS